MGSMINENFRYEQQCSPVTEKKCTTGTEAQCEVVNERKCETVEDEVCEDIPSKQCRVVNDRKCSLVPKQECRVSLTFVVLFICNTSSIFSERSQPAVHHYP